MAILNFGLAGVGADVQYGKGGGHVVYDSGNSTFQVKDKLGAFVTLQAKAPVSSDDVTTKEYVDSVSAGLDPKQSVRVASTADISASYSASAGAASTGGFTSAPTVVDGITLADGDRVLLKNQTAPTENGIYEVISSGTWTRATDQDGSPASEVSSGNFTFVEEGASHAASGWVLQGAGIVTLNTDAVTWVQFSEAGQMNAGIGLSFSGNTIDLDYTQAGLVAASATGADTIAFHNDTNGMGKTTITDMINALDVVQGITADGFVVRTADDTYASRTFASGGGLVWTDADGINGNPTVAFDFAGLTAVTAPADGTQEVVVNDAGTVKKISFNQLLADKDIVTATADGILVRTADDTYSSIAISANTTLSTEGIAVTGTHGEIIGLDIVGRTAKSAIAGTDAIILNDATEGNVKTTIAELATFVADNAPASGISKDNSSITIVDDGVSAGAISVVVDGNEAGSWTTDGLQVDKLLASNLSSTEVVFASTGGELVSDSTFTFSGTTLSVGDLNVGTAATIASLAVSDLTETRLVLAGASGELSDSDQITFAGSNLNIGTSGSGTGLGVDGNVTVGGDLTVGGTFGANGLQDTSLTIANAVTFSDVTGDLDESINMTFVSDTLVLGSTGVAGNIEIGNATDGGVAISGNTVTTLGTNEDLVLLPNGTGEVKIGSGGAGAITADTGESLVIEAGGNTGALGAGSTIISGGEAVDGQAGDVELRAGQATGTGTHGTIKLIDANDNIVIEIANEVAGATNSVEFQAGITGEAPTLRVVGSVDTDVDLTVETQGDGLLVLSNGAVDSAARAELIRNSTNDDVLVTKAYLDEEVGGNVIPGSVASMQYAVDFTADGTTAIGSVPAGATVLRVTLKVDAIADAPATISVSDASANVYMSDAENDPETAGVFFNSVLTTNGASPVAVNAIVASNGSLSGSGTLVVEYRNA